VKKRHENPFADLSELEINCGDAESLRGDTELYAELRFSVYELDLDDFRVEVGVSKATLQLELWGCQIKPGSRLNDGTNTTSEHVVEVIRDASTEMAFDASLDVSSGSTVGGPNARASRSKRRVETERSSKTRHRVKAKAGQKWIVEEPDSASMISLDDTYISNERLCILVSQADANLVEAVGTVIVRKADLNLRPEGLPVQKDFRKLVHKEKIMKALLAKSLAASLRQERLAQEHGILLFSRSIASETEDGT
jgi:hypothetical protein